MPPLSLKVKRLKTVSTSVFPVIQSGIIDGHLYIYSQSITAVICVTFKSLNPDTSCEHQVPVFNSNAFTRNSLVFFKLSIAKAEVISAASPRLHHPFLVVASLLFQVYKAKELGLSSFPSLLFSHSNS